MPNLLFVEENKVNSKLSAHPLLLSATEYVYSKLHPPKKPQFFNINDCFQACNKWTHQIPNVYDVIIGVPRAGLMYANILACKLGRPLSTPDNFLRGEIWFSHDAPMPQEIEKVLVVEDSVGMGKQIGSAANRIKVSYPYLEVEKASLFVIPQSKNKVEHAYAIKDEPNIFEWNILTATWSWGNVVSSLEGVLCFNCPAHMQGDLENYIKYVVNAKPLLVPTYPLKAIVTMRPESMRVLTEAWLRRYNVRYESLVMRPDELPETFDTSVMIKSDVARLVKPFWFWEQNPAEAEEIHRRSDMPVLCTETMTLIA